MNGLTQAPQDLPVPVITCAVAALVRFTNSRTGLQIVEHEKTALLLN